jgi:predicted ATPase
MEPTLTRHDHLLRDAVESHNGAIVKTTGDGLHAVFASAADGLHAALRAQQAIGAESWPEEIGALHVRMGLHAGEAELRAGDYYGTSVNRAARIMSIAYGDHVLLSRTVAGLVQDTLSEDISLRDLGEHTLRDLSRPMHLFQLCHPDLPVEFPPLKSPAIAKHNLIAQLTSFVGRESELADVIHQLELSRLLTLLGPGGTGKTRLMLQVAEELIDKYPDGVWLVELAPLTDPSQLAERVAAPLQVQEQPGREMHDVLVDSLRRKELLLLLDNVEHLVRECAEFAQLLLTQCPKLKILVTGREALFIGGETTIQVPSLSLPETQESVTPEAIRHSEGVQLFLARAQAVRPDYDLSPTNAAPIGEIVRRLDGIPLAIELAAARLRMLSAEQIAERLSDRFRLLTGGSRTALPRQQTLQSLIDWSWDLLAENEQVLLRRLSVFSGGWTLESAQSVAGFEPLDEFDIFDSMEQLVNKSLITVKHHQADEARYGMLESIRQYARDRLFATDEGEAIRDRHADYFVAFALEAEPHAVRSTMLPWANRIILELDNLRSVLAWTLEDRPELALRISGALLRYDAHWIHPREGRSWLEPAIDRTRELLKNNKNHVRIEDFIKALHGLGRMRMKQGKHIASLSHFEESVQLAREAGETHLLANGISWVAFHARYSMTPELMQEVKDAIEISREGNDDVALVWLLFVLAMTQYFQGNLESGLPYIHEALELVQKINSPRAKSDIFNARAVLAIEQGNFDEAKEFISRSIENFELFNDWMSVNRGLSQLAHINRREGNLEEAVALYRRTILGWQELGHQPVLPSLLSRVVSMNTPLFFSERHPKRAKS